MWIKILKTHSVGSLCVYKDELREMTEAQLKNLPADCYQETCAPWDAHVDPVVAEKEKAEQEFLRLQLEANRKHDTVQSSIAKQECLSRDVAYYKEALEKLTAQEKKAHETLVSSKASNKKKKAAQTILRDLQIVTHLHGESEGLCQAATNRAILEDMIYGELKQAAEAAKEKLDALTIKPEEPQDEPTEPTEPAVTDEPAPAGEPDAGDLPDQDDPNAERQADSPGEVEQPVSDKVM